MAPIASVYARIVQKHKQNSRSSDCSFGRPFIRVDELDVVVAEGGQLVDLLVPVVESVNCVAVVAHDFCSHDGPHLALKDTVAFRIGMRTEQLHLQDGVDLLVLLDAGVDLVVTHKEALS